MKRERGRVRWLTRVRQADDQRDVDALVRALCARPIDGVAATATAVITAFRRRNLTAIQAVARWAMLRQLQREAFVEVLRQRGQLRTSPPAPK